MSKIIKTWEDAEAHAKTLGKSDVLYCLSFSHGLMKVGRSGRMVSRLKGLSCHGLLKPLLQEFFTVRVTADARDAEAIMLRELEGRSERIEKEVFRSLDAGVVRTIMSNAAKRARAKKSEPSSQDFDDIARASNMYAGLLILAIERAEALGMHERAHELRQVIERTPADQLNNVVRTSLGYA